MSLKTRIMGLAGLAGAGALASCSPDKAPVPIVENMTGMLPNGTGGGSGDLFVDGDDEPSGDQPANSLSNDQRCLGETYQAEAIGLDIFVMLDISGSMLEPLPQQNPLLPSVGTKWDAVRQSLQAFVQDPSTADIGVGIQYFPQVQADVPFSCEASAECGPTGGPCSNSVCVVESQLGNLSFLRVAGDEAQFCLTDDDCTGAGSSCRTLVGECVLPPGVDADAPQGTLLNLSGNDTLVSPVCSSQVDCQGLPRTLCDPLGICQSRLALCTSTIACPAGNGGCTRLPNACVDQTRCEVSDYSSPAVAISSDQTRSLNIIASLEAQQPQGLTPTGPALAGALAHAQQWADDHPGRQVVTVLATDGFPTECAPVEIGDIAQIADGAFNSARPVRTFVIGVFGSLDLGQDGQARLNEVARAGGSDQAIVVNTGGNVADEFLGALNLIRDTAVSCEFRLEGDRALDFDQVNLQMTEANGAVTDLYNVGDLTACGADDQGWYYVMNAAGTPSQINVCPSTCGAFMAGGVRADLQIGCKTRIR